VLTIEPGVYVPKRRCGARIEDDVLVTESGHEVLSRISENAQPDNIPAGGTRP
jgi:Xaa-Pro aminopeptidase